MILLSFVQPVGASPVQPRPAPPAAVPSPETELEQATLISAALGAYEGGEMFYAYVSSSLQQLRERRGGSPLSARAPSPVPQARAVAVAQGTPPAPTAPGVALAAPASQASTQPPTEPPTEQSADLGECAEALLELSRTTRRRPRDAGAPSAEAQTTWSVWSGSPAMDPSAVTEQLKKAEECGDINSNSCRRLEALHELLIRCETDSIVAFETATGASKTCILGWSKLNVHEPAELNVRIREMVKLDLRGIWRRANGMHATPVKNATWGVYELLRKIGVKPRLRGPDFTDPGKHDMVYYKQWEFCNGDSFRTARLRLAKGFAYCPEKGMRPRKLRRVEMDEKPVL
jgi:hypothetical protein